MKDFKEIRRMIVGIALATGAMLSTPAKAGADAAPGAEFFESKIRPILVDNCYKCHSSESEKLKGGLRLDTKAGVLKGGDTGPAIVPGDPDKSLLIKAVRYADEDLQMPPKGKKLSAEQIAALEEWVRMGAPDPRASSTGTVGAQSIGEAAKTHWAFKPVREPAIPTVKNQRWVRTPVDNFILSGLEAHGMAPSPQADKRTLIRRAYYDLTGLPPAPARVADFVSDSSPDAFAKLVDELLASPRYGERWGRHWLDVARYADTKGYVFEEDRHYPYSYTYRDYVIRAFNEDLPYDSFIKQQIAADLMNLGDDKRPLAALGYLTLGRRFVNNIHDIIDDRIDVVCRGMMGLTVACARCHDHKYDPIPTKDYYSLYGVFASSMEPEVEPLLGVQPDSKAFAKYKAERDKREATRTEFKDRKEKETAESLRRKSGEYMLAAADAERAENKSKLETFAKGRGLDTGVLRRWINGLESWKKDNNPIFVPWFEYAALSPDEFATNSVEVTARIHPGGSDAGKVNPLVSAAFTGDAPSDMKQVSERYDKLFDDIDKRWQASQSGTNKPAATALPEPEVEAIRQVLYASDAPANLPHNEFDRLYDVPTAQKLRELQRKVDELDATHPGAPPRAMALVDKPKPYDVQVFVRGNSDNRGPEVPRQFLEVVAGSERKPFHHGSGRLELAEAIASPSNPLTARVFVNRVWMYNFGAPMVSTPSDFGLRSDPPTNPALLDFLASEFMKGGWSVKKLHRLIMLSSAYQQGSADNPAYSKIDPGNQLLWHMNRQRLDFEALRDTLMWDAGRLDLTMGGHAVDLLEQPFSTRRTVYGYIDRQNLPGLFRSFDLASPDTSSPRRFSTTVPQQALFLMNSPFIEKQARDLMHRPDVKQARSDDEKVRIIYQVAFQRDPTHGEMRMAREFIRGHEAGPGPRVTTNWVFGYGAVDDQTGRVKDFHKLPYFDGRAFQGGPELPDSKTGWVVVSGTGGHPGNDQQHAAVRRWIAPRDGAISIQGVLKHPTDAGDGVRGRVFSSRSGVAGTWIVHNSKEETHIGRIEVKAGDNIDFVTDCRGNVDNDSFTWSPKVRYLADGATTAGQRMEWSALNDFAEAAQSMKDPPDAWQEYAQVLLLTNELDFVD